MDERQIDGDVPAWILGIDLGANSLGWAAFRIGPNGEPGALLYPPDEMTERPSLGVRIFDEGVENYGQGEREQSRAVKRRQARLQRRQAARRARRLKKTFGLLQSVGLLPSIAAIAENAVGSGPRARDAIIKLLDRVIPASFAPRIPENERARLVEHLPYALRAHSLRIPLERHELGRTLYALAQRRGFLSNRKTDAKDPERGKVKEGIKALTASIEQEPGPHTLGSYLYGAALRRERIRSRWTSRRMFTDEFDAIWSAQAPHHPDVLTDEFRTTLRHALFHQRPLKDQSHLIGQCEIENGSDYVSEHGELRRTRRRKRAPECLPISQSFRLWQTINNLRVKLPDGTERSLTAEERNLLADRLDARPADASGKCELGLRDTKRLLDLPAKAKLNIETAIKGNRTNAQMLAIFDDRWRGLDDEQQEAVVMEIWSAVDNPTLIARAKAHRGAWELLRPSSAEAELLDDVVIGGDYMSLSRAAMRKLLPEMRRGLPYATAVLQVYGRHVDCAPQDRIPPVHEAFPDLRNPAVMRSLSELRRVVNTLVAAYGRPEVIRVELARDLKRGKEDRKRAQDGMRSNERERDSARERIVRDAKRSDPTADDILRVRLWEECGGQCPYSGRVIGFTDLFGGQVDIEHILPFSLSLDDSFANKTVCFADVNRNQKRNRTPFEAFGHDAEQWEEITQRVRKHVADKRMSEGKLRRFLLTPEDAEGFLDGFKSSQLNDTRHASVRARELLASLYGGHLARGVDHTGRTRVQVGNGSITALVRGVLGINRCLPTGVDRKRDDHRHHAIDAVAIAMTSASMTKRLSDRADQAWAERRRRIGGVDPPWPSFSEEVREAAERIVPSFRIDNHVSGPLHAETIYSPRRDENGQPVADGAFTHIRKPVESLSNKDVDAIVDPRIREVVRALLDGRDPKKVCVTGRPETYPQLQSRDGRSIPVLRVRIRKGNTTWSVGAGQRRREVENDANHHLVVRDVIDAKGRPTVAFELVSMFEAYRRKARREPIVTRGDGFRFSLRRNDVVRLNEDGRVPQYCRITVLSAGEFEGCDVCDARTKKERSQDKARIRKSPSQLATRVRCSKVTVSPIGVVRPCRA